MVMLFFSLEIAKKCFFVLYFLKNMLYFCELFKWVEFLFKVFIYNTKIGRSLFKANPGSTIFWQKNIEKFDFRIIKQMVKGILGPSY